MKVYIASDHGGFNLKNEMIEYLKGLGNYEVSDLGPETLDPNDDYPIYASKVAEAIQKDKDARGIIICKSGIGVSITANRFNGIFAANCNSIEMARLGRSHNDINVLCLDSELPSEDPKEIAKTFLETEFSNEERHIRRIQEIKDIDAGQIELRDIVTNLPLNDVPQIRE
jgi:RpiB/LacA/LacB family sugar-phosphate isomerase